ncbi:MAG: MATE family efflux transporter [Paraprevotella sp.]|nr:MATE family efflux transporter [Paraprevotella sp.]
MVREKRSVGTVYSYRDILRIAYPILISLLMEQMIGMTDTIFLGRVGVVELGASAIAGIYYLAIFMMGFGFGVGAQILMARRNGEQHYSEIGSVFYQGIYFMLGLALFSFLLTKIITPRLLPGIVSSPHVYRAALSYIDWRIFGFFFSFVAVMFRAFFVGTTQTKILTMNSVIMVLSNVVFNYTLVFGHFGLPRLGIAGAAIGSSLAEMVSVIFFVIYTFMRIDRNKYGLLHPVRFNWQQLRRMLSVSFWKMVQNFYSLATWFLFFLFVEHLGEQALAVTNVVRNISGIPFMVVAAFASTCSALVSNLIGAGREDQVRPTINRHVRLAFMIVLPMVGCFALFPRVILGEYTNIPDLITAAVPSLWVYCTTTLLMTPGNIYFSSVSGTGNTRMAFIMECVSLAGYTLYIYVIIQHLRFAVAWCWTSEYVYWVCILLFCLSYIKRGHWKSNRI